MLPRLRRVRLTTDIQTVYTQGVNSRHSLLRISALPTQQAHSRATVVVSKRVHLNATVRNRVKRRIRATLSQLLPRIARPHDIVVTAQPRAAQADAVQLRAAVEQLLHKLNLL